MCSYFDINFSKYQCGFRMGHNNQYYLISMTKEWKKATDKNETFAAHSMKLLKMFKR